MGRLGKDRRGVVMVEFLICVVPILVLFLMGVQLTLIAAGKLIVAHAAQRGARAAVVVLEDDPMHYDGVDRRDIRGQSDPNAGILEQGLAAQLGQEAQPPPVPPLGGPRMADIRRAAYVPLLALAQPGMVTTVLWGSNLQHAIEGGIASRLFAGLLLTPVLAAVTLPTAPGAATLAHTQAGDGALVTVRVTYALSCLVPLVSRAMCDPLQWDWLDGRLKVDRDESEQRRRAIEELRLAPGAGFQQVLALSGLRFALLQAEVTLPTQHAAYDYASEGPP